MKTRAPVLERRRVLLTLAGMTGAVVGCWRRKGGEGPPRTKGRTLPAALKPTDDKLGPRLPLRRLGNTGVEVTLLGAGGVHIGDAAERDAEEVIETAIAEGIRFFDTANMYSEGRSEQRLGRYLVPKYRDHVFLMSKSLATSGKGATEDLETSLRRCGCDYLDLWQIHALKDPEDADNRVNGEESGVATPGCKADTRRARARLSGGSARLRVVASGECSHQRHGEREASATERRHCPQGRRVR